MIKKVPTTKVKEKALPLRISPSAWHTWGKCALSLQAPSSTLKPEADDYAASGTNLHAQIARELLEGIPSIGAAPGDDAELVRFAVRSTLEIKPSKAPMIIEKYLSVKIAGITIGGTADAIIIDGDTVIVIDHKTGWREVEAEGNMQLKIYAHLFAQIADVKIPIIKWRGVIINARFNSTSYTEGFIDGAFLKKLAADIKSRSAAKQTATGNHCAYCARLSICAPIRAEIKAWLEPGVLDGLTRRPEELAAAMRLSKPAEKLFDAVKKEAQLYMDLGGVIPGVAAEYTAGTRAWPRDMGTEEIAEKIGIDKTSMFDEKVISPAEAEKRGASKEAINSIAIRPPRKGFKFS